MVITVMRLKHEYPARQTIIHHRYRDAGLETDWIENSSEYHQRWHQPVLRNALQVIHTFMSGCPGPELANTNYIRSGIISTDHIFIGRCARTITSWQMIYGGNTN